MSLMVSILIFLAGVVVSGLLFKLLRQRIPEALANGLTFMVLGLAIYPIVFWATSSREQFITIWIIACVMGTVVTMIIHSLLRSR